MADLAALPYPPLNFDREGALRYTGWAPKFFDMMVSSKRLAGRKIGRNGTMLYPRDQLEEINRTLGGAPANDVDGEFDAIRR
jgi:hypothetical protein